MNKDLEDLQKRASGAPASGAETCKHRHAYGCTCGYCITGGCTLLHAKPARPTPPSDAGTSKTIHPAAIPLANTIRAAFGLGPVDAGTSERETRCAKCGVIRHEDYPICSECGCVESAAAPAALTPHPAPLGATDETWCVIFKRDTDPIVYLEGPPAEMLAYYERLAIQWTGVVLCKVLVPDASSAPMGEARARFDTLRAAIQAETDR